MADTQTPNLALYRFQTDVENLAPRLRANMDIIDGLFVSGGSNAVTYKGNGTPSGAEFGTLAGSNTGTTIQAQLNTKVPTTRTVNGQALSSNITLNTDNIGEGSTNLYFTNSRFDTRFGTKTTDNLTEGSTNLYFTNARADARITAQKAVVNGLATLDAGGKIPTSQLPALAITNTFVVASQAAMLALTAETGDVVVRSDLNKSFILRGSNPAVLADWQELLTPTDAVLSVNGQIGAVTLTTTNINEGTNLYFTNARARSALSTASANQITYNSTTGAIGTPQDIHAGASPTFNSITLSSVSSSLIPDTTDARDLGSSIKLWRKGWLSELDAVLFAQNTASVIGGWLILAKNEGTIPAGQDVATANTSIDFGQAMTANDFVLFRAAGQVEYVQVGTLVSGTRYNVTRNLDGSGANNWAAGTVYLVLGNTGNGRIELNANSTPRISMITQGATYNAQTEMARMGDLNGAYDYVTETYGFAAGQYATGKSWFSIDAANGLRMGYGTTITGQWDTSGQVTVGVVAAGWGNVFISGGNLSIRNNTTTRIQMNTNSSGYLANSLISWDTSGNLTVAGNATIAGWSISSTTISSGGINLVSSGTGVNNRIYVGTGSWANSNTGFYVDGAGNFSLQDKLTWAASTSTLTVTGKLISLNFAQPGAQGGQWETIMQWESATGNKVNADGTVTKQTASGTNLYNCTAARSIFSRVAGSYVAIRTTLTSTQLGVGHSLGWGFSTTKQTGTNGANPIKVGWLVEDGNVEVWANGSMWVNAGAKPAGTILEFRVYDDGSANFYFNDVLYVNVPAGSLNLTQLPLYVVTYNYYLGDTIPQLIMYGVCGNATGSKIHPLNIVNVAFDANDDSSKSGGTNSTWGDSGFFSQEYIPADTQGGIEFEVTTSTPTLAYMAGLSTTDTDQNFSTINYAAQIYNGNLTCWRNGTSEGSTYAVTVGDKIRLARETDTGNIVVRQNGVLRVTFSTSNTAALYVDTAFYSFGITLKNLRVITAGTLGNGWQFNLTGNNYLGGWQIGANGIRSAGINLIPGVGLSDNKIYISTNQTGGTWKATDTPFYVDGTGNFSLGAKFSYDGTIIKLVDAAITMSGSSAYFSIGSTPPTSASAGTGIWLDRTGLYGLNTSVLQTKIDNTGALLAGAGNVIIDAAGVTLKQSALNASVLTWKSGTYVSGQIDVYNNAMRVYTGSGTGTLNSILELGAFSASNAATQLTLTAQYNTLVNSGWLSLWSEQSSSVGMIIGATGSGTSPTGALDVRGNGITVNSPTSGNMGAGTINVATGIYKNGTAYTNPDYVFEHYYTGKIERFADKEGASEYQGLMPLSEVERIARTDFHLPWLGQKAKHDIFSGSDAALANLEAAYLYIFQLEKRIQQLEERI